MKNSKNSSVLPFRNVLHYIIIITITHIMHGVTDIYLSTQIHLLAPFIWHVSAVSREW